MTNEPMEPDSLPRDNVILSFDTLVRAARELVSINGVNYERVSYDDLSFNQLAAIERRRRIVQSALINGADLTTDEGIEGATALRELTEYLLPDATRAQVIWTPPPSAEDPEPAPRPVRVTDTLNTRQRLSVMNLFIDPSRDDAFRALAARVLRGTQTEETSTSEPSPPDSTPPTAPLPSSPVRGSRHR